MYSDENAKSAIEIINGYIQENLYYMHPKTVDRWWDVKHEINNLMQRNRELELETGKDPTKE